MEVLVGVSPWRTPVFALRVGARRRVRRRGRLLLRSSAVDPNLSGRDDEPCTVPRRNSLRADLVVPSGVKHLETRLNFDVGLTKY